MCHKTSAASRPAATPPIAPSTIPAALVFADALGLVVAEVLVAEEVAAAELTAVDGATLVGWRVPHVPHDLEPGYCFSQSANNRLHSLFGRVPWYWAIFEGPVPLEQVQKYTRVSYVENYNQYSWGENCGSSNVECGSIAVSKEGYLCYGRCGDREEALTAVQLLAWVNAFPPHKIGQLFSSLVHH